MNIISATIVLVLVTNSNYAQNQSFDTILINNKKIIKIKTTSISNELLLLTATVGKQTDIIDTIYRQGLAYIEYPDFNKDGNSDILMDYYGNNQTFSLYIFNPITSKFIKIDKYSSFPNSIQLTKNSKYYYSYHTTGCADYNWASDLFKIENYRIIHLAHIDGIGCDFEIMKNPQEIRLYKISNNNSNQMRIIAKLPYLKLIPKFGDKWKFLDKYWNTNYTKF